MSGTNISDKFYFLQQLSNQIWEETRGSTSHTDSTQWSFQAPSLTIFEINKGNIIKLKLQVGITNLQTLFGEYLSSLAQ